VRNYGGAFTRRTASAGFRGAKGPAPTAPIKLPPTMLMCLAICATCACHLVVFNEESLYVDAIIARPDGSVSLEYICYCDETTITLIGFLKVRQDRYLNLMQGQAT